MLLVTIQGLLFSININKTGRTVKSIECKPLDLNQDLANPTCILSLNDNQVFVGSSSADAKLLQVTVTSSTTEVDIDEDELYGGGATVKSNKVDEPSNTVVVLDTLPCLSSSDMVKVRNTIVVASGQGKECRINVLHTRLELPSIASFSVPNGQGLFPLSAHTLPLLPTC